MKKMRKTLTALLAVVFVVGLAACSETSPDDRERDAETQADVHGRLQSEVPVPEIEGAAAREAIVRHLERWQSGDVVSFVTVFADTGNPIGYYEASGKVASTCQMLTAPERIARYGSSNTHVVQAPALDGTYYTAADCGVFFFTATGDTYVELAPGLNYIVTDQPLPIDVEPLEVSSEADDR